MKNFHATDPKDSEGSSHILPDQAPSNFSTTRSVNQTYTAIPPDPQVLGGTTNIKGGTFNHIEGNYNVSHHEQGLNRLIQHIAPEAMHNSAERYPPPNCHPDTRKNILTELTSWIERPQQDYSILWLHAPAGHGKSAILQNLSDSLSSPNGRVAASFFFGRGKGKREQARYLFNTIAYQLAISVPGLRENVEQILYANPTLPMNAMNYQVESLIVKPFATLDPIWDPKSPFTVIIDGLDECSDPIAQQVIIELVGQIVTIHQLPLRFLIASRPEPHILEVFNSSTLLEVTRRVVTLGEDFGSRTMKGTTGQKTRTM